MTSLYQSQVDQEEYQEHHNATATPNSDGWILYYSPEGFPYYYNEVTGESRWAEYEEERSEVDGIEEYEARRDEEVWRLQEEGSSDEESESEETVTGTETSNTESDGFEAQFQEYLQTPEGQQELEDQRMALEKYSARSKANVNDHRTDEVAQSQKTPHNEMLPAADDTETSVRYNPYQQQSFQDQYTQQQLEHHYRYEKYKYEYYGDMNDDYWHDRDERDQFIEKYGLPLPQHQQKHVSFKRDRRKSSRKKSTKMKGHDDIEGGEYGLKKDIEQSESDSDSSVDSSISSDDSDVRIIKEDLLPYWMSWNSLSLLVDRTIKDPVVNIVSKTLGSGGSSAKQITEEYDEEGGSGDSNSEDENDSPNNNIYKKINTRKAKSIGDSYGHGTPVTTSTDTAEFVVDGQTVRRGVHEKPPRQSLPP